MIPTNRLTELLRPTPASVEVLGLRLHQLMEQAQALEQTFLLGGLPLLSRPFSRCLSDVLITVALAASAADTDLESLLLLAAAKANPQALAEQVKADDNLRRSAVSSIQTLMDSFSEDRPDPIALDTLVQLCFSNKLREAIRKAQYSKLK